LQWFEALPDIYGSKNLKKVVDRIVTARQHGREVGMSLGAHVLKVGLSPLLIDLMRRGFVTHVATNGASAIHDWETAYQGATSEDVATNLPDGSFGFWRETFTGINGATKRAHERGEGLGLAIGRTILEGDLPYRHLSVFSEAARLGIPATVHAAIGCDIVHMDPDLDGAALPTLQLKLTDVLSEDAQFFLAQSGARWPCEASELDSAHRQLTERIRRESPRGVDPAMASRWVDKLSRGYDELRRWTR
jgi:hypothetical protein